MTFPSDGRQKDEVALLQLARLLEEHGTDDEVKRGREALAELGVSVAVRLCGYGWRAKYGFVDVPKPAPVDAGEP